MEGKIRQTHLSRHWRRMCRIFLRIGVGCGVGGILDWDSRAEWVLTEAYKLVGVQMAQTRLGPGYGTHTRAEQLGEGM